MSDARLEDAYAAYQEAIKENSKWRCDVQTPPEPEPDMCLNEPDAIAMESNKDA